MSSSQRRSRSPRLIIGFAFFVVAISWVVYVFATNLPIPSWYLARAVVKVSPIDNEEDVKVAANRPSVGKQWSVTATRIKETATFELAARALSADIATDAVSKAIDSMTGSLKETTNAEVTVVEDVATPSHSSGPSLPMAVVVAVVGAMLLSVAGGGFVISGLRR